MNSRQKEIRFCIFLLAAAAAVFLAFFAFLASFFAIRPHAEENISEHPYVVMEWRDGKIPFLFYQLIADAAKEYRLDPALIAAVIERESGFNSAAAAFDGGQGLMQLMPEVSREQKCRNPYNPAENIRSGAAHLNRMLKMFSSLPQRERTAFALAAYNGGPGHVFDARKLAKKLKLNPNRWKGNVAETIQFLNCKEYYSKAEYGRCNGIAIAAYVECVLALQARYQVEFLNLNSRPDTNSD